jgi:hypothetical protein
VAAGFSEDFDVANSRIAGFMVGAPGGEVKGGCVLLNALDGLQHVIE